MMIRLLHGFLLLPTLLLMVSGGVLILDPAPRPPPAVPSEHLERYPRTPTSIVRKFEREKSPLKAVTFKFSTGPTDPVCIVADDERGTEYWFAPSGHLIARRRPTAPTWLAKAHGSLTKSPLGRTIIFGSWIGFGALVFWRTRGSKSTKGS